MMRAIGLFRNLLKFGFPLYLMLLPATALYGWFAPWPPAQTALAHYSGQTPVLVGASYNSHYSGGNGPTVTSSRSYVLLPTVVSDPKILTLTQRNGAAVTSSESRAGFFFMAVWLCICVIGTRWFWRRQVPPNNSFKPKPLRGSA